MRRRSVLFRLIFVATLATPLSVSAQRGDPPSGGGAAKPPAVAPCRLGQLFCRTDFVRFEIVLGRIIARDACHGKSRIATQGDLQSGSGEVLTLRVLEGSPRIQYQLSVRCEELTVSVTDVDRLEMKRTWGEDGDCSLRFVQHPRRDLQLTVTTPEQTVDVAAPSLWHLWLQHPELCRRHLAPCLKVLRPSWRLDQDIARVESKLLSEAAIQTPGAGPHPFDEWLKAMRDDRFRVRQAAFRQFQEQGVAAKAYLDQLDLTQLDGEQRARIEKLRASLTFHSEDRPARVAAWLRDDRTLWFAYLNDPRRQVRSLAHQQLSRLCGDSLPFDPLAPPDSRAVQMAQLESRVFQ